MAANDLEEIMLRVTPEAARRSRQAREAVKTVPEWPAATKPACAG